MACQSLTGLASAMVGLALFVGWVMKDPIEEANAGAGGSHIWLVIWLNLLRRWLLPMRHLQKALFVERWL